MTGPLGFALGLAVGASVVYVVWQRKALPLPAPVREAADEVADAEEEARVALFGDSLFVGGEQGIAVGEPYPQPRKKSGCGCGGGG